MYAAKEPEEGLWDSGPELNIKMKNIESENNFKWTNEQLLKTSKWRKCNKEGVGSRRRHWV